MVHTFNPSPQETDAGELQGVCAQPGLYSETASNTHTEDLKVPTWVW